MADTFKFNTMVGISQVSDDNASLFTLVDIAS